MARQTKAQIAERAEFVAKLKEAIQPGDTLYTVLRHVSRSGMMRHIDVYLFKPSRDGQEPCQKQYLTYWIAKALDYSMAPNENGIKMSGCGMDMGFSLVYDLGHAIGLSVTNAGYEADKINQKWL